MMNCFPLKRIICCCICLSTVCAPFAQTIPEIKQLISKKQLMDARETVERFLAQPAHASAAEAWYFKGYIYQAIAETDSLPLTEPRLVAFESYKKCLELEPKNKWLASEQYVSFFSLYNSFFGKAATYYKENNFSSAFDYFVHAEKIQQYIFKKGFSYRGFKFTAVDTGLLLNTAICAFKGGKKTEGIVYYAKLADARIPDPEYLPVYHALIDYFSSVKDEIAFRKYLSIGRKLFPYDQYWVDAELSMIKTKGLNAALIRSYEEKIRKDPSNFNLNYSFCTDLFNMLFSAEPTPQETAEVQRKLEKKLEQLLPLQQNGVNAELLNARYYFNNARSLLGTANETPQDSNTEKIRTEATAQFEKARSFAQTVYQYLDNRPNLKRNEIENFKIAANILAGVADIQNQTETANTYRNKITEISKIVPVRGL
jgi:tetratricopeptide (TPR) repeat protein